MRKTFLIGILFTILFSCEKKNDFCESNECDKYFRIWKELLISRNHLTEAYFNEHIFPYSTTIDSWNDGKSFRVEYKIRIDWAEAKIWDQFIIWLDVSTNGLFPSIPTPRDTYLNKDQIDKLVDKLAFSSSIHQIAMIDQLKYSTLEEALQELRIASGIDNLRSGQVVYEEPSFQIITGNPILKSGAVISDAENKCISCQIDLVTGETEVREHPCRIYYCFAKGTQITLKHGKSLPIESLKNNDTILSINIKSLSVEEDIIQKMDSVIHTDMIHIKFNDSTINYNTSDHPYFVKGKGWCSFKPEETMNKYGINTKQLQIGDVCFKYKNNLLTEVKIEMITEQPGAVMTYNISRLAKNKNYFANRILVSNEQD